MNYSMVEGSHPNMSLFMEGDTFEHCNICNRSLEFSETALDDKVAFQNVFERVSTKFLLF